MPRRSGVVIRVVVEEGVTAGLHVVLPPRTTRATLLRDVRAADVEVEGFGALVYASRSDGLAVMRLVDVGGRPVACLLLASFEDLAEAALGWLLSGSRAPAADALSALRAGSSGPRGRAARLGSLGYRRAG